MKEKTFERITESPSNYSGLEKKSTSELLRDINQEDLKVALAVQNVLPSIAPLVDRIVQAFEQGGRLFYIGAGTSGRLGILDASECPPTYGVPAEMVIGMIAGGDRAIRKAVEHAEDDKNQAWKDLQEHKVGKQDVVVGIAASGTTPYVVGGLGRCQKEGIATGCITCNPGAPLTKVADYPIVVEVGPEYITGSTRMKSGTAQKMVLNMLTSASMIRIGRVKGNKMVHMQLSNSKLLQRAIAMIQEETGVSATTAQELLERWGSVHKVISQIHHASD